jgi:hypothetical protein
MVPARKERVVNLFAPARRGWVIFMHLIRSQARTWRAVGVGLFWLGILSTLTMSDYFTRIHAAY